MAILTVVIPSAASDLNVKHLATLVIQHLALNPVETSLTVDMATMMANRKDSSANIEN